MSAVLGQYRLHFEADTDPSGLACLLVQLQNRNLVPRKILAEWGASDRMHVEIDIADITEAIDRLMVAKMREMTCVIDAHWSHWTSET
jgi:hypothetical protein